MVNFETLLITTEYVREALDQLIQIVPTKHVNPLEFLYIVDLHMLKSDFTFFQNPRNYALHDLLVSVLSEQYAHQRGLHQLSAFAAGITLAEATKFIREDSSTGNADLIGWSWLYFHYVEISLHISQHQFGQVANIESRTIRRYQNTTIKQLTKRLIQLEQNARAVRRRQMLCFNLPHQGNVTTLIERDQPLQRIINSKVKHYSILGASGIGKSVFVEQVLKHRIDNDELDNIAWIESPGTIEVVKSHLYDKLLNSDSRISLVEFVSLKDTAIVLDDAEKLLADLSGLQDFLREFSNASIYIISQHFVPLADCLQVTLRELSLSAAQQMLGGDRFNIDNNLEIAAYARAIWQSVGGNPLAMELLAHNWLMFEIKSATKLTLDKLYFRLFETMSLSEQLAWLLLALLKDSSFDLADLAALNSSFISYVDFVTLGRLSIIETSNSDNPRISITVSACRYIQTIYESKRELRYSLDTFVAEINSTGSSLSELHLILIESILSSDWVSLSTNNFKEALHSFWKEGLNKGHFVKWHAILGHHIRELEPDNIDLAIGYGISQRCLGNWSGANSVFNSLVHYTGMHGMFTHQAHILLELAILMRYQGDYSGAITNLNRVESLSYAITIQARNRLLIEKIEIALETNQFSDAKLFYSSLPYDNHYRIIFQLEAYLKENNQDELPFINSLTENLLLKFATTPSVLARTHILISRIHEKDNDVKSAIKHLSIALSILMDEDNDPFALARAQSNLAVLLTKLGQLKEAEELLRSADYVQRKIGDRVGLAVTMHNTHALIRKIVN